MRYCAGEEDTSNGITGAPAGGGLVLDLGGWVAWYWVGGWVALAAAAAGKTCSARPLCAPWGAVLPLLTAVLPLLKAVLDH